MSNPANYHVIHNSGVPIDLYGGRRRDLELSRWAAERHSQVEAVCQPARRITRPS